MNNEMDSQETSLNARNFELAKTYVPRDVESRWYEHWLKSKAFEGFEDVEHKYGKPFTIMIPPPNVTGSLHCGHALFATIQDILIRHARMLDKNTLWLPGTDHAGIATQVVVERLLAREGTNRHALGRTKFLERVWDWKRTSGGQIYEQLKVMGCSLDWRRERFTMDESMSFAVREAFVRLYEEGLIYRAERLVNWSVGSQTVLSDLEVENEEENGELFDFAYTLAEDSSLELIVSTTRPETMLGDTAVAVHPEDERYRSLIGRMLKHPFVDRKIPVIADSILVDPSFGTGAVKVTPAHDFNDFATGKRHNLPMINIFNRDGTMNENAGEFTGLDRFVARKAVKKKLEELGFVRGSKMHRLSVPRCSRTNTIVEPMLSEQWYVRTEPLAKPAIEAVETGKTVIVPEEWTKTFMHWMTNIQDWCISRQLWWGHQIPAWHCADCKGITVARTTPNQCKECKSTNIKQDDDVLDTWFSSGLWPFATLGWPEQTYALETFYPTTVLETGFDILFFWVARMMMMGIHFMGETPFSKVYLHGMVTDENGDKMAKVKGNVIDPLDVIYGIDTDALIEKLKNGGANEAGLKAAKEKYKDGIPAYGADALRWTLATYPPQQRKIPLSIKRIEGGRLLCNKLWNATRFALSMLDVSDSNEIPIHSRDYTLDLPSSIKLSINRWILSRLQETTQLVQKGIDQFRLDEATSALYHFFWNDFCDWYIELVKVVLMPSEHKHFDRNIRFETRKTLASVLDATLRLMHPFIPFITEELWQKIPKPLCYLRPNDYQITPEFIITAAYPHYDTIFVDSRAEQKMSVLQAVISTIRTVRSEHNVVPSAHVEVILRAAQETTRSFLQSEALFIQSLAKISHLQIVSMHQDRPHGFSTSSAGEIEVLVKLKGLVSREHEELRIERELKKIDRELVATEKKLSQPSFTDKAPIEIVTEARNRLKELQLAKTRLESGRSLLDELDN